MRFLALSILMTSLLIVGCHAPCVGPVNNTLPPASMLMHPGPGVDGPGPGVMSYQQPTGPAANATSQIALSARKG